MKGMFLTDTQLERVVTRATKLERLVATLHRRLDNERLLLIAALHQLAEARGARDRQAFARSWIARERRSWQRDPVPIDRKEEGGGDQREPS